MPQSNEPITRRPRVEDESTGDPEQVEERHGKHREDDPGVAGKGSEKGGLNRDAGVADAGDRDKSRGTRGSPGEST